MPSRSSSRSVNGGIQKLDFDSRHKPPASSNTSVHSSQHTNLLDDDESFFLNVVEGAIERDRRQMARLVTKYASFATAILSCLCAGSITAYSLYGPLFQSHLKYTQYQVNAVSTTAELAMYLPVPLFGWLCDRYNPRPLSAFAGVLFGVGYLLAALTYRAGPIVEGRTSRQDDKDGGSPFAVMVLAFVGVGAGTSCMYLSAVTTCAKNFGRGKHKGLALAMPIAAFGLSGMWQSQVGSHFFKEQGGRGDTDVYRYFLFLAGLLFAVGLVGAVGLNVVNEEELIDDAVDELERSGVLEESPLFQRSILHDGDNLHANGTNRSYGALSPTRDDNNSVLSHDSQKYNSTNSALKKTLLLNAETRIFLTDPTMWFLAAGFFLTTGPGEAFINNLGTIVHTLYPPPSPGPPPSNSPTTHVSIVALTSTIARLATGTLSDLLAPTTSDLAESIEMNKKRLCTISRMTFLLTATFLFALGQLFLATPLISTHPNLFPVVSALVGLGYGAVFSLTPIIVSVVWGVQNFGTNWGIVAVVPAAGAALWGAVYSAVYQAGVDKGEEERGGGICYGGQCYQSTFLTMALASCVAMMIWAWAWRSWRRRGIAV